MPTPRLSIRDRLHCRSSAPILPPPRRLWSTETLACSLVLSGSVSHRTLLRGSSTCCSLHGRPGNLTRYRMEEQRNQASLSDRIRAISDSCIGRDGEDFASAKARMQSAREAFYEVLADQIAAPLNAYLASMPQSTAEEKQLVARTANNELRQLGLTIKCPKTGYPAHLRGVAESPEGRFQLCLTVDGNYKRPLTSKTLPQLSFMIRPVRGGPSRSQEGSWESRTSANPGESDRSNKGGPRGR